MIKVDIRGLDKTIANLAGMGKQVRFAAAKALTQTAWNVRREIQSGMPQDLDRPRTSTTNALRVEKATPGNLTAVMRLNEVGEGVPAAAFLKHNIIGGLRAFKRSELMLQQAGILPRGMVGIPGSAAKLDAHGNMQRGQIVSILSFFRTFGIVGWNKEVSGMVGGFGSTQNGRRLLNTGRMNRALKKSRQSSVYFVVPPGMKMSAGIWQKTKTKALPLLMFVTPGRHRKLLKLKERGEKVIRRDFNKLFDAAFIDALRTAR